MPLEQTNAGFVTTRWTLLGGLQAPDGAARQEALDTAVRAYWPPVYATLRRLGHSRDDAAETTQAFFAEVILGRDLLAHADRQRGRLRTLILAALKNFTIDRARRRTARGQGRTVRLGDLEREEQFLAAAAETDADALFDRRWALAVVEEAFRRCEAHYRSAGKPRNWDIFLARVVGPATGRGPALPLARAATDLGFASPADAAAAVQTVKKRLLSLIREVTAEVTDDSFEDEEYRRIVSLLA